MSKKIILSLILAAAAVTPAMAGGHNQPQPRNTGLLGLVAKVAAPNALANVTANLLGNTVRADVKVGASQPSYGYGYGHNSSSSIADINVNVPGIARVQADVGQQNRHGSTLLGISANVLSGGVGQRGDRW
jgi:hypothetical protein